MERIPLSIQPFIHAYLQALEPLYARFYGIYIYGSLALGAFEEQESDIDIVALMQGEWAEQELKQLQELHKPLLRKYPLSKRLDVQYIPAGSLRKDDRASSGLILRDGKFLSAKHADLNAVTCWITRHQGICLLGPECASLPLEVTWQEVLEAMRFNLDRYWASKAKRPLRYFLLNYWVMTAVATLCRILSAIEEGEIVSKSAALTRWRDQLPGKFQQLVDEARRIRQHSPAPSLYRSRLKRMRETLALIEYARTRGHKTLDKTLLKR